MVTQIADGGNTCICAEPIPFYNTHTFTAKYQDNGKRGGYIGIVKQGKSLELSMGKHEAWALESSGYAFLDSIVFKDYFTTQFTSPTTVIV